jgi:hypothetical protein
MALSLWDIATTWVSEEVATFWLLGQAGTLGTVLWALGFAGFVLAGITVFIGLRLWSALAVGCAALSLVMMVLLWQPTMWTGAIVDAAMLVALVWAKRPRPKLVGS